MVKEKKKQIKRINFRINAMTWGIVLLAIVVCVYIDFIETKVASISLTMYVSFITLLSFKNVILVWAICRMRSYIKKIGAVPNEKVMVIHFVNVAIFVCFAATSKTFTWVSYHYKAEGDHCRAMDWLNIGASVLIAQGVF